MAGSIRGVRSQIARRRKPFETDQEHAKRLARLDRASERQLRRQQKKRELKRLSEKISSEVAEEVDLTSTTVSERREEQPVIICPVDNTNDTKPVDEWREKWFRETPDTIAFREAIETNVRGYRRAKEAMEEVIRQEAAKKAKQKAEAMSTSNYSVQIPIHNQQEPSIVDFAYIGQSEGQKSAPENIYKQEQLQHIEPHDHAGENAKTETIGFFGDDHSPPKMGAIIDDRRAEILIVSASPYPSNFGLAGGDPPKGVSPPQGDQIEDWGRADDTEGEPEQQKIPNHKKTLRAQAIQPEPIAPAPLTVLRAAEKIVIHAWWFLYGMLRWDAPPVFRYGAEEEALMREVAKRALRTIKDFERTIDDAVAAEKDPVLVKLTESANIAVLACAHIDSYSFIENVRTAMFGPTDSTIPVLPIMLTVEQVCTRYDSAVGEALARGKMTLLRPNRPNQTYSS